MEPGFDSTRRERTMQDIGFVVITIAFFVLSIGYVRFCERMR